MDMGIQNLMAARLRLQASLALSKSISTEMDLTGVRLNELSQRLPFIQAMIKPMHPRQCCFTSRVNAAITAAGSVLKVSRTVHDLKLSLMSLKPYPNLSAYLSALKQLEDALNFLSQNSALAVKWLEDVAVHLEGALPGDKHLSSLKEALIILLKLEASNDRARLGGGCVSAAYDKLEIEFRRLLCTGAPPSFTDGKDEVNSVAPSPLPVEVIQSLQLIADRLNTCGRIQSCGSAYAEVRGLIVRSRLRDMSYDYIDISTSEMDNVQTIEDHIETWRKNMEFAIKYLLDSEYSLVEEVFALVSEDTQSEIFADTAIKSGILELISFGYNVTKCKKDPIKLLKLLEVFEALINLRTDFNKLFSHQSCAGIQSSTRDLIRRVVYGAWDIFQAFSAQVELQRHTSPPVDGSVHKLLNFVVNYCNKLLDDRYAPLLSQVLYIHQSWNNEKFQEEQHLELEVQSIMKAIEVNLDSWAMSCGDTILSYLFTMNNRLFLCKNLEGTKLGELMGDPWVRKQKECVEYYATLYFRESWSKLVAILNFNDSSSIQHPGSRISIKKKLKSFNESFDEMYRKHSKWVITERALRDKVCQVVKESVVNSYREFMSKFGHLLEHDVNIVRYSPRSLENILGSLFLPELGKYGSSKNTHFVDKLKSVVANQFRSNLAAA